MENENVKNSENGSKEEHIYTETWMNGSSSYHSIPNGEQIFGQPYNWTQKEYKSSGSNPYIPQKKSGIGFSIAGMSCGIVSIALCGLMILDLIIAIPGLILSIVSLTKKYDGKGMAIAGVICSALGIIVSIGFMGLCLSL